MAEYKASAWHCFEILFLKKHVTVEVNIYTKITIADFV